MKLLEVRIPDRLDREMDALVELGWFGNREQIVREAIRRFLEAHRPELMERFVREDVAWGCVAGPESQRPVICDAGPLNHLDELGCTDLLRDFPRVLVAEAVWHEAARTAA